MPHRAGANAHRAREGSQRPPYGPISRARLDSARVRRQYVRVRPPQRPAHRGVPSNPASSRLRRVAARRARPVTQTEMAPPYDGNSIRRPLVSHLAPFASDRDQLDGNAEQFADSVDVFAGGFGQIGNSPAAIDRFGPAGQFLDVDFETGRAGI